MEIVNYEPQKIRNLTMFGATGVGKSELGTALMKKYGKSEDSEYFKSSDKAGSCTMKFQDAYIPEINARIIDSPGFGDTHYDERFVDQMLQGLTNYVVDVKGESTDQIDAFILVTKLTPRAAHLKQDIEHLRNIFGRVAYKSVVLLVIDAKEKPRTAEELYEELENDCREPLKQLLDQKPGTQIRDWTLCWDNINPRKGQFEELLKMLSKVEPYTNKKFMEAQKEIRDAIDTRLHVELEREKKILDREFEGKEAQLREEKAKMEKMMEEEKKRIDEKLNNMNQVIKTQVASQVQAHIASLPPRKRKKILGLF